MAVPAILSTVPAINPYIQYIATTGQTVFPYPFPITQDSDLIVVVNGVTLTTDNGYSLSGQGNSTGGNVTFTIGQSSGTIITLYRNIAIQRITQIAQNAGFSSTTFNAEFNNIYLIMQQLQEEFAFTLQVPGTNSPPPTTVLTPANYAGKYLAFDNNGNPTPAAVSGTAMTQAIVGSLLNPVTNAETAVGAVVVNSWYAVGVVDRYGTNTVPGTTNMLVAFQTAINVVKQQGGGIVSFLNGSSYFMGAVTADGKSTPVLQYTGLSNVVFRGNGSLVSVNTTADVAGCLVSLVNPSNVAVYDLHFTDNGFDQSKVGNPTLHGTGMFFCTATGTTDSYGLTFVNCAVNHALTFVTSYYTSGTARLRAQSYVNMRASNIYFGLGFQQQGDEVQITNFVVTNPVRAYFPYGVTGHTVDMTVVNDGTNVNAGSNACVDIKRYDFDTKEIKVRVAYIGDSSIYGSIVNLEADVTSNAPATFDGIDIDLRLAAATVSGSSVGFPLQFRDVTGGSTQSTTATIWKRINLRGDFGAWPTSNVNNPVNIASVPTTPGRLSFEGGLHNVIPAAPQHYPGFQIRDTPESYVVTNVGNLTTGNVFTVDLSAYQGTLVTLRVQLYMQMEYQLGTTSQAYREYYIQAYNSAGTVTISSTNLAHTYSAGTPPTVTVSASGATITFATDTYNNALGFARMRVETVGKFI